MTERNYLARTFLVQVSPTRFVVGEMGVGGSVCSVPGTGDEVVVPTVRLVTRPADRRTATELFLAIVSPLEIPERFRRHFVDEDMWCFTPDQEDE